MRDVWLRQNVRAIYFGMVPPALMVLASAIWLRGWGETARSWTQGLAWAFLALGLGMLANLAVQLRRPRIAYCDGKLSLYLRSGAPIEVPIEIVEAFLLGVGPAMLSGRDDRRTEARILNIRLAERAAEWAYVEVKPALGKWCSGYITIRGTWCEPLNIALVNRLNQRLADAQKRHVQQSPEVQA